MTNGELDNASIFPFIFLIFDSCLIPNCSSLGR